MRAAADIIPMMPAARDRGRYLKIEVYERRFGISHHVGSDHEYKHERQERNER